MFRQLSDPNFERAWGSFTTFTTCLVLLVLMTISYQSVVVLAMLPRPDHWFVVVSMTVLGVVCLVCVWLLAHSPISWVKFNKF